MQTPFFQVRTMVCSIWCGCPIPVSCRSAAPSPTYTSAASAPTAASPPIPAAGGAAIYAGQSSTNAIAVSGDPNASPVSKDTAVYWLEASKPGAYHLRAHFAGSGSASGYGCECDLLVTAPRVDVNDLGTPEFADDDRLACYLPGSVTVCRGGSDGWGAGSPCSGCAPVWTNALHAGGAFTNAVMAPQRVPLLVGAGTTDGVTGYVFDITNVTALAGWCGNAGTAAFGGNDFSFSRETDLNGAACQAGPTLGWCPLWCKDAAARCVVMVTPQLDGQPHPLFAPFSVTVPRDIDGNGVADVYEKAQVNVWNGLYDGVTNAMRWTAGCWGDAAGDVEPAALGRMRTDGD